jgi:hypothetical protein
MIPHGARCNAQPGRNARQALGLTARGAGLSGLRTPQCPDCWPGEAPNRPRAQRRVAHRLSATAGKTY